MDQKAWIWKKKSTEKALVADQPNNSLNINEGDVTEIPKLLAEKGELERDLALLNDKLSAALSECNSKDNFAKKQVKIAQEAIAGWEKAETEAKSLKKDLDKVIHQKAVSEERSNQLEAALKDCMQQLCYMREGQEKRIQAAVVEALQEFDRTRIALEERLAEAGRKIVQLDSDNTHLKKALSGTDKIIQEFSDYRAHVEADHKALALRVDSTEKENASLKYELLVLEKELDIRNEEAEFSRRAADVAQKQHKESVQKIATLESECQKLRLLVKKRLPGPAALTTMKNEADMLGRDHDRPRRKKNYSLRGSVDFPADAMADTSSKGMIPFLTEQLNAMEEENRSLRCALTKRSSELQVSRNMYVRSASRLSRGEGRVAESVKSFVQEHSVATSSDIGSDDRASCAESWASALISELENFKNEKQIGSPSPLNMGGSEMHLMDDFVEMEKLAVVSVSYPPGSSHRSSEEGNAVVGPLGSPSGGDSCLSEPLASHPKIAATGKVPGMLDDLLKMLLERCQASGSDPHEVVEDIKVALARSSSDAAGNESTSHLEAPCSPVGGGHVFQTLEKSKLQSNVGMSIQKVITFLEGITNSVAESFQAKDGEDLPSKNVEAPTGYCIRVFQGRPSELYAILQQSIQTCNHLLNGEADLADLAEMVSSNLDWVVSHCLFLQDASIMKESIQSGSSWDESKCGNEEADSVSAIENNRQQEGREELLHQPRLEHNSTMEETGSSIIEQATKESSVVDLKGVHQLETVGDESFIIQLYDSGVITENWESESETTGQSKGDEIMKQRTAKKDLSSDPCNNQIMQLKSTPINQAPEAGNPSKIQLQSDWEINAASKKLAECQQTILNLGKQFKALASPNDAALSSNVMAARPADCVNTSPPTYQKNGSQQLSLLDNMLAEDSGRVADVPRTSAEYRGKQGKSSSNDFDGDDGRNSVASTAIVPVKKNGGKSFLKKLFRWHKKGKGRKTPFL